MEWISETPKFIFVRAELPNHFEVWIKKRTLSKRRLFVHVEVTNGIDFRDSKSILVRAEVPNDL